MNDPDAWDTTLKLAAVLMLVVAAAAIAVLMTKHSGDQPRVPIVNASGCELRNPCATMKCEPRKGPFGGVDPDAGERDQRRIS